MSFTEPRERGRGDRLVDVFSSFRRRCCKLFYSHNRGKRLPCCPSSEVAGATGDSPAKEVERKSQSNLFSCCYGNQTGSDQPVVPRLYKSVISYDRPQQLCNCKRGGTVKSVCAVAVVRPHYTVLQHVVVKRNAFSVNKVSGDLKIDNVRQRRATVRQKCKRLNCRCQKRKILGYKPELNTIREASLEELTAVMRGMTADSI
ncbi:hypothetical protein Ahia01_000490000 [Argonauta hians]